MRNYVLTGDTTINKIKTTAKEDFINELVALLKSNYDNVSIVRVGNISKSNEISVQFAEVEVEGEAVPLYINIATTTKEFTYHKSKSGKEYEPYDYDKVKNDYLNWVESNTKPKTKKTVKENKADAPF